MTFISEKSGLSVVDEPIYKSELGNYKIYTAILNQSGTNAPIATVIQNTIGEIVWTRSSLGSYLGTLAGAFPAQAKTFVLISGGWNDNSADINCFWNNADSVYMLSSLIGLLGDDLVAQTSIEIRVYN